MGAFDFDELLSTEYRVDHAAHGCFGQRGALVSAMVMVIVLVVLAVLVVFVLVLVLAFVSI